MNLISKKDLLAITGISYGQLYRWKRERLIPEEWFIKQSAYTGQETFFPREQILSRIRSILDLKDQYSLEEMAKILSPGNKEIKITLDDLTKMDEFNQEILDKLPEICGRREYEFTEVVFLCGIQHAAEKAGLSISRCTDLIRKSLPAVKKLTGTNVTCTIFRADQEYHTVFTSGSAAIAFDDDIEVTEQISLSETADRIKVKYKNKIIL